MHIGGIDMATNKRVFTLRLSDKVFDKIGILATKFRTNGTGTRNYKKRNYRILII